MGISSDEKHSVRVKILREYLEVSAGYVLSPPPFESTITLIWSPVNHSDPCGFHIRVRSLS